MENTVPVVRLCHVAAWHHHHHHIRFSLTFAFPLHSLSYTHTFVQVASKRTKMCRALAREVVGLSPYEKRILDMIKTGGSAADKRVYKFAKRRLGSHKRAVVKREDIKEVNAAQRARAAGV